MKKRLLSALLALTLALSLAACGGNSTGAGSGASSSAESGAVSSQPTDENLDEEEPEKDAEAQPDAQPDEGDATQTEDQAIGTAKPSGGASSGTSKPSTGTSKPSTGTSKPSTGTEKPSGSGSSSSVATSVDLKKFYNDTVAAMTDAPGMTEITSDLMDGVYPGLSALKPKQTVAYMAMISAVACEVTALELSSAEDAKAAAEILRARIKQQGEDQGAFYPETVDQWKNHSQVIVNGNYVLMAVGAGNETFAANFNALTK